MSGGLVDILDTAGTVVVTAGPCEFPTAAFPDGAAWCNAEGRQLFRITAQATCLQSITDDDYYIKYVKTQSVSPPQLAGGCTLVRVSRNAPGTWTEIITPETDNGTAGAAIEWAYDAEPVD
eukprot:CAMPEP_0170784542 /NCGR_PEP_ID=MMETSP0733-20121128/16254_1 /TAXON_ID=186038 /ORGANISM="Fragilariopsis kerguelensis, Strain L26-C5" /LENGTH=120 /DNA_ID=CAMNT_0011129587 /DNA_START=252 /DNA_END=614 /DNA_ORIENTATION=-